MRNLLRIVVVVALIGAACSDEQPGAEPTAPVVVETLGPTSAPQASTTTPGTTTVGSTSSTTSSAAPPAGTIDEVTLQLVEIVAGFEQPVLAISPPGDDRLFVVDQPGQIWLIDGDTSSLFVDLSADVVFGGERGLLGLAFHPDFASNGRFFVNYTGDLGATRIVELRADASGSMVYPASQQLLLEIAQPARNHNGGMIAFGPDGYLWIATGDGGGSNDEFGHGQRPDTLLAALLRIDVSVPGQYDVPPDNPFVGGGGAPEVWAYGLRNPWRFAFDGDQLLIADVGQNEVEEINRLPIAESRGANFGWPIMEGSDCFRGPCDEVDLIAPVLTYGHGEGCSVTGGYVYRADAIPELTGQYFYADYCSGWIRSVGADGVPREWFAASRSRGITSFGQDATGRLYVVTSQGSVLRIERADT